MESDISRESTPTPERSESSSPAPRQRRGRGRPMRRGSSGRGRRVGRGSRGRGRGGHGRRRSPTRADIAIENLEERQALLETRIDGLSEDDAKDLLKRTALKYPSLIFDLLKTQTAPGGSGYHPPPGQQPPSWCVCGICREMPTEDERLCCGKSNQNCISRLPDFAVLILDEAVLALARLYRREVLVLPDDDDWCKANRHCAYRQFVLWHHGRLGAGIRRVIPSCCVWRIRDKFPDAFGQYTGYIPSRYN